MPIGLASGITVAQPISSSLFAKIGSALMYGSTVKPSSTSFFAASSVAIGSGRRNFGSGITSSLIQLFIPIARESLATRSASSTVEHPAVLGKSQYLFVSI